MDHGVQDFRLDAVKFPFPDFISRFTHEMIQHSEELGRPDPYIVGEWSGGGVGDAKSLAFANRYDYFRTNILDFTLSVDLNQFIGGTYEDAAPTQKLDAIALDDLLRQRVPHSTDEIPGREFSSITTTRFEPWFAWTRSV